MEIQTKTALDPPLKWAGGKRWLAPKIKELFDKEPRRRLVEPFCGGLSVALHLQPDWALLNDINIHLINFYRQVQNPFFKTTIEYRDDEELYYQHRALFNSALPGDEATALWAELFYYLNKTGYNGLCRFNKSGKFNVPIGRRKSPVAYITDWAPYQIAFESFLFRIGDFATIPLNSDHDFLYCDPPYDCEFTQYSPGGFTWSDQQRLISWLTDFTGPVLISNQATPRIVDLYSQHGFKLEQIDEPRRISCTGDRKASKTILASRNI